MANYTFFRFLRSLRTLCAPITAVICFSLMLTYVFILYQPTVGPGITQRMGWQSWDSVSLSGNAASSNEATGSTGTDWWDTSADESVDYASLPLDVWAPLLPHDTGLSEIALTRCLIDPAYAPDICKPDTTPEQDAIKGNWVRVDRNVNLEAGYLTGFLNIYYRRTRRQDVNLVTDLVLLPKDQSPTGDGYWKKAELSARAGVRGADPLFLWYQLGKTAAQMSADERKNIVTEIDVHFGDDIPWYGFEKLQPPTLISNGATQDTFMTFRRGVKLPPKAPDLHFSHEGKFKILQVADLHYSVSLGHCRDVDWPCDHADNLTNTLLGHVMDEEKPDLVVFTGDQLNGQSTSWDPKSVLAKFARAAMERKTPWAAVFGNHDSEVGLSRAGQMELMKGLPYNLVSRGPQDIHGVGNYLHKVYSADASKTHLLTLYFLDSGDYAKGIYNFWGAFMPTSYDYLRQNQIDWFLKESGAISPISRPFLPDSGKDLGDAWDSDDTDPVELRQFGQLTPDPAHLVKPNALMFFHIPLPESYAKADQDPQTGKDLIVGLKEDKGQGASKESDGFFEKAVLKAVVSEHNAAKQETEVKVIANGHCHLTENCRRVKGVWLCFGGGGSYSGYGKIGFDRRFRVYDISDYGETIETYKRTEKDEILDRMFLAGKDAPGL